MSSVLLLFASCKEGYTAKKAPVAPSAISVASDATSVSIVKGDTYRLQAKVLPEYASDKRLSFSSSAEGIASVNAEGVITAHEEGNAVITIRAANGVQKAINLTVTPEPVAVTGIEFEAAPPASLIIGDTYKLTAKAKPDTATNKSLTYAADNNNVIDPLNRLNAFGFFATEFVFELGKQFAQIAFANVKQFSVGINRGHSLYVQSFCLVLKQCSVNHFVTYPTVIQRNNVERLHYFRTVGTRQRHIGLQFQVAFKLTYSPADNLIRQVFSFAIGI